MGVLFWLMAAPTALLALLLLASSAAGQALSAATPVWLSALSALAVLVLIGVGHQLGYAKGKPGFACLMVVLAWIAFAAVMLLNGLLRQNTWQ